MSSRIRENPDHLFELFVEIGKPSNQDEAPFILQQYPADFSDKEILKHVPKFAFPSRTECTTVDHFTFVLTDLESKLTFGFCRHATGAQTCLCVLSFLPWFETFYSFLNLLSEISNRTMDNDIKKILREAYVHAVPFSGSQVTLVAHQEMFSFTAPDPDKLLSIPASRNLTEYYNAMDTPNMTVIFCSLLHERRILVTSKKLSRVTACVHAAATLIYPMHWQHLFIPVLPESWIDHLYAPMPYIIGVHSSVMEKVNTMDLGDIVLVDTDSNLVQTEYDDLESLPEEVMSTLKKMLRTDRVKNSMQLHGDGIARAFLMALVKLIGGYRDALRFRPNEPITFQPEAFLLSRPPSMRPFLENMLQLQIFREFINERLDMLNCGKGFSDIFEKEATFHADKLNAQSRYKEWHSNMKKQGKKLQKGGKEFWEDFMFRAAPVMTSAVQSVKNQSKKAYTGIKSKIGDLYKDETNISHKVTNLKLGTSSKPVTRTRPSTILGPELRAARPPRPPPRSKSASKTQKVLMRGNGSDKLRHYKLITLDEKPNDDIDLMRNLKKVSINLVDDPDIQLAMRKSVSLEEIIHDESDGSSSTIASSGRCTPSDSEAFHFSYIDLNTIEEHGESLEIAAVSEPSLTNFDGENNLSRQKEQNRYSLGADTENWFLLNRKDVEKPRVSRPPVPVAAQQVGVPTIAPPVPPPRQRGNTLRKAKDEKPLIKFDSVDSMEEFDPLSESTKPQKMLAEVDSLAHSKNEVTHERKLVGSVRVSRMPAFRKGSLTRPKRIALDRDSEDNLNHESSLCDPLFDGFYKQNADTNTRPKKTSETVDTGIQPSHSSELLCQWDLHQLTPNIPPKSSAQVYKNMVVTNHLYSSPELQYKTVSPTSPQKLASNNIGTNETNTKNQQVDPFAELVGWTRSSNGGPSPKPKTWQAFN